MTPDHEHAAERLLLETVRAVQPATDASAMVTILREPPGYRPRASRHALEEIRGEWQQPRRASWSAVDVATFVLAPIGYITLTVYLVRFLSWVINR